MYVSAEDTLAAIPRMPQVYDEPFSDSSQIPTYLLASLTRKHVSVCLSGDGGDELFCGYKRYWDYDKLQRMTSVVPGPVSRKGLEMLAALRNMLLNFRGRPGLSSESLPDMSGRELMYAGLVSHWRNPWAIVPGSSRLMSLLEKPALWVNEMNFMEHMMFMDLMTYLPDDIMVKVDRASMAVGLEARSPFIDDHNTVELAWRMPHRLKYRDGKGKWILRKILESYIPSSMIERPKMGFGVPIDKWLRGSLKGWAEDLLSEHSLSCAGYVDVKEVRKKWTEHSSGTADWHYLLWDVLMFQSWLSSR